MKPSTQARYLLELSQVVKIVPKARIISEDNKNLMLVPRDLFYKLLGNACNSLRARVNYAGILADFIKNQALLKGKTRKKDYIEIMQQLGWFQPIIGEDKTVHIPRDFGPWYGENPTGDPDFLRSFFFRLEKNQDIPIGSTKEGDRIDFGKDKEEAKNWSVESLSPTAPYRIPAVKIESENE